jgi:hypothetical protein
VKNGKINFMRWYLPFLLLIFIFTLVGCYMPSPAIISTTHLPQVETVVNDPPQEQPTLPVITPTPTVVSEPVWLSATVWEELPQAPILMYHRFDPQPGSYPYRYTTSLTEFDQHLHTLYDAEFSLVSLDDWLRGNIHLQEGRRPLIITIDDLFYADQISLDESGNPAPYSGIGRLWNFSQEHPEFNFDAALFYNLGDKGYLNYYTNGVFTIGEGWREARARAIAWCIENGAMPMNHFYEHPFLNKLSPDEINWQLEENDRALRDALALIGREDLSTALPNILALPYVVWPETEAGKQVLYNYINPEGAPVAAIIEGDYAGGAKFAQAPFSHEFSRWHIPRISASTSAIGIIIDRIDQIPVATSCELGEFWVTPHMLPELISTAILKQTKAGMCPYGYYVVNQWAFYVQEDVIIQYSP